MSLNVEVMISRELKIQEKSCFIPIENMYLYHCDFVSLNKIYSFIYYFVLILTFSPFPYAQSHHAMNLPLLWKDCQAHSSILFKELRKYLKLSGEDLHFSPSTIITGQKLKY